jgi:hypothetical protein
VEEETMTAGALELGLNSFGEVATDGDRVLDDAEMYDIMHPPREARARTIELLGRDVAPRVQELLTMEPTHV